MKITYQTTAELGRVELFSIIKEYIENKTNKKLANIYWKDIDDEISCELNFCSESVELTKENV